MGIILHGMHLQPRVQQLTPQLTSRSLAAASAAAAVASEPLPQRYTARAGARGNSRRHRSVPVPCPPACGNAATQPTKRGSHRHTLDARADRAGEDSGAEMQRWYGCRSSLRLMPPRPIIVQVSRNAEIGPQSQNVIHLGAAIDQEPVRVPVWPSHPSALNCQLLQSLQTHQALCRIA